MLSLSGIQWMALDLSPAVSRRGYDVHGKIAAGTVFLGIMILGAYVYITRSEPHPLLAAFFRTAFFRSPFEFVRSNVGPHILLLLSLVLVGLSVLTHRHRRCVPRV